MTFRALTILIISFLWISGAALMQPAHAQRILNTEPQMEIAPPASMDEIPDEYIEESMRFYDSCQGDPTLMQYYNCQCLSVAFLDERVKRGPMESKSAIQLAIDGKCRDATGSAGFEYNKCLTRANSFEPGTDPEEYCQCVANTYVKLSNRSEEAVSSRSIVKLRTQANVTCRNPDLARKLFPVQ